MLAAIALGVSIERLAYRPLRGTSRLGPLISALGVSLFLQNAVMLIVGARPRPFPALIPKELYHVGGAVFTNVQLLILFVALLFMVALDRFVRRTRWGKAMRAVAQDAEAAGSVFAARTGFVSPESFTFVESVLVVCIVVIGGSASIAGVILGAVVFIGLPELLREAARFRMLAFGLGMVLLMIARPQGLLGKEWVGETMKHRDDGEGEAAPIPASDAWTRRP